MKRKELEAKLQRLNVTLSCIGRNPFYLDYARYYGGYCLTDEHGSYHYTKRMPAQQLFDYMDGITLGIHFATNGKAT